MRPDVDTTDCTIFRYKSTPLAIHYAQLSHRCLREDSATERAPRTRGREAIEGGEAGFHRLLWLTAARLPRHILGPQPIARKPRVPFAHDQSCDLPIRHVP